MRMLDSYYSGDINKDEMTALKDKYDKEIEKINAILQKQQNNQTAIQERQNNTDELRDIHNQCEFAPKMCTERLSIKLLCMMIICL